MDSRPFGLGAVLAGGKAVRMGGRKADLVVRGRTLADRTLSRIEPFCNRMAVVGGDFIPGRGGVPTIPDLYPGTGTIGGVATALKYALDEMGEDAWVLCVACDMPFLRPELLSLLAGLKEGCDAVVPRTAAGFEPLCSLYRAGIHPVFLDKISDGDLRVRKVFELVRTRYVDEHELKRADPDLVSFVNLNTMEEVEKHAGLFDD